MFTGLSIRLNRRREIVYEVFTHYSSRPFNWKRWANLHQQAIHLETLVRHLKPVVSLRARCVTIWFVNKGRYVRAWGALVRRGNVQRRTKESVPIFNKAELSMDRIVKDVMRTTYVYVARKMQSLTISWAVCARLALIICLEPKGRRVHVRDAVVRSDNVERRT